MPTVVLWLIFELRTGCSFQWRRFVWHCAAEKCENLSVCGRVRFRFARMRFEQRNSAWIETESARSPAEASSLVVLYGRVRRGGGKGGRGGEDCQIWRNEQRSLVRQEITKTWVWTSLIQTNRSTTLVWAPCGHTCFANRGDSWANVPINFKSLDRTTYKWDPCVPRIRHLEVAK